MAKFHTKTIPLHRVVVTGYGAVTPIGTGCDEILTALKEAKSGITFQPRREELEFDCQLCGVPVVTEEYLETIIPEKVLINMSESMKYSALSAIEAFRAAGYQIDPFNEGKDEVEYPELGTIMGTGICAMDKLAKEVVPLTNDCEMYELGAYMVEQTMASSVSANVNKLLGFGNQVSTNSSACATGLEAAVIGFQRIQTGRAKGMIVGGTEGSSEYIGATFDAMGSVLNNESNDNPEAASRPMSATADGFIPGSGAGVLMLESLENAVCRKNAGENVTIYAEVLAADVNSGGLRRGGSMTFPNPFAVKNLIRQVVLEAGIKPRHINYINGHLTGTKADPFEVKNWAESLEIKPEEFPLINSEKALWGHGLGAAGGMELVALMLQLHHGFVHKALNSEDLQKDLLEFAASIPQETIEKSLDIAMKASFGFGDVNAAMVLRKWNEPMLNNPLAGLK